MIDPENVSAVLLADGWHEVDDSTSPVFELVQHGFAASGHTGLSGAATVPGFLMREVGVPDRVLGGPLSSVLAVRYKAARR